MTDIDTRARQAAEGLRRSVDGIGVRPPVRTGSVGRRPLLALAAAAVLVVAALGVGAALVDDDAPVVAETDGGEGVDDGPTSAEIGVRGRLADGRSYRVAVEGDQLCAEVFGRQDGTEGSRSMCTAHDRAAGNVELLHDEVGDPVLVFGSAPEGTIVVVPGGPDIGASATEPSGLFAAALRDGAVPASVRFITPDGETAAEIPVP